MSKDGGAIWFRSIVVTILLATLVACTDYDHDVPDTAPNLRGFERHFGFEAPPDVTDVYYFADEMGVDVLYQLGFEAGPETVTRIVKELDLTQSTSASDGPSPDLAYEFPWWDEQDVQRATRYWKSNAGHDYWWALWYRAPTQRVYYLEYSL